MLLKPDSGIDHCHILGHRLGRMIGATRVNFIFFYYARSKNNIILINKIMVKEKSTGVDMIFPWQIT